MESNPPKRSSPKLGKGSSPCINLIYFHLHFIEQVMCTSTQVKASQTKNPDMLTKRSCTSLGCSTAAAKSISARFAGRSRGAVPRLVCWSPVLLDLLETAHLAGSGTSSGAPPPAHHRGRPVRLLPLDPHAPPAKPQPRPWP